MNKDIDIENLLNQDDLFKPLSDGLGFHHSVKEKKEVEISLKQKSMDLKRDLNLRTRELNKQARIQKENVDMGELTPFYNSRPTQELKEININLDNDQFVELDRAPAFKRFSAYSIDLILLAVTMLSAFIGSVYASNLTINDTNLILNDSYNLVLLLSISILFYSLYFSFFDRSKFSTIGKRIMGLKLISTNSELKFSQTILRSFLSLVSLVSFGFFNILKLEDKLTESIVISNE